MNNAQAKELYDLLNVLLDNNPDWDDIVTAQEDMPTEELNNETIPERDRDAEGDIIDSPTDEIVQTFDELRGKLSNVSSQMLELRDAINKVLNE